MQGELVGDKQRKIMFCSKCGNKADILGAEMRILGWLYHE
jgi:hypothetical protein